MKMQARPASFDDAHSITSIYNQGIEDRTATFETQLRTVEEIQLWFNGFHPIAVVEAENEVGKKVIAFAATFAYRPRSCYRGIAEISVYVQRDFRSKGAGRLVLSQLIELAEGAGFWKLLSRVFPENQASRSLVASLGFREVGTYEKHGHLDGIWRDVVIVERLIAANLR